MKTVLLTPRIVKNDNYPEERDAFDVRWAPFLAHCGILPTPVLSRGNVEEYFDHFAPDGVLLSGGNDLACVDDNALSRRRDRFESEVLKHALLRELPVLGICRGLQFLAWKYGGTLKPIKGHVNTLHKVEVDRESRYLAALDGMEVNSFHSVAPIGTSDEFVAAARSHDGYVEALEHKEQPMLGIMWHPERYDEPRPQDVALISSFFGSV